MNVNIKDIARIAGVSISTVSLVLNNRPGVSALTRLKVQSIVDKLNYIPNNIARSLVTRKTKTIGLIVADIAEIYFGTLARVIQDALNREGYSLIICNSDYKAEKESVCLDFLIENNVDGIIMVPRGANIEKIKSIKKPIVFLDNYIKNTDISVVRVDNENAGYIAIKHLIKLGHKLLACITGPVRYATSDERITGYQRALNEDGIEINSFFIKHTDWSVEGGFQATKEILSLKITPDAIFVTGDTCAIGVFKALSDEGLKIPDNIAIVGFDDMKFSPFLKVPLTTVRQPMKEMGEKAVELIIKELRSKNHIEPQMIILKTELIIRESCGYKQ